MKKILFVISLLLLAFIVTSQAANNFKVWKTIELGKGNKSELIENIKIYSQTDEGISESKSKENLYGRIKMEKDVKSVKLVLMTLEQLGYNDGFVEIRYDKICSLANKLGMKLCPDEVVLRLPFEIKDGKACTYFVATEPKVIANHATGQIKAQPMAIYGIEMMTDEERTIKVRNINLFSDYTAVGKHPEMDIFRGTFADYYEVETFFVFVLP